MDLLLAKVWYFFYFGGEVAMWLNSSCADTFHFKQPTPLVAGQQSRCELSSRNTISNLAIVLQQPMQSAESISAATYALLNAAAR